MGLTEALLAIVFRRDLGRLGEAAAARHLRRQGLRIVARNWRTRWGEVDLIARSGDTLVFVEVKSRATGERGDPLDRVDPAKVRRLRSAARAFCHRARGLYSRTRIDGVVVEFRRGLAGLPIPRSVRWYPAIHNVEEE